MLELPRRLENNIFGTIDDCGTEPGLHFLPLREGYGVYDCKPVYIYMYIIHKDHTSVGHRVHVKPVLDVSEFLSELMTRPNVTFPF